MQRSIILASASSQRKAILSALDIEFEVVPSEIDEKQIRDDDLGIRAEKLARAKAEKVAESHEGIVIAADTFLELEGGVLEKPGDPAEAAKMLLSLSEKQAKVYTGFCYLDSQADLNFSACFVNTITARAFTQEEIEGYVHNHPVTSWSGGFSPAYAYGLTFFKNISGSPSAFTHGFPMDILVPLLVKSGIKVVPKPFQN